MIDSNMRARVIGFHDIVEDGGPARPIADGHATAYTLERSKFRAMLQACRLSTVPMPASAIHQLDTVADKCRVFVTFDDGALSAYTRAAEDLDELGCSGAFFITTEWIGRPGFLDRRQIRELDRRGHTIGSHSRSHPHRMSCLEYKEIVSEWRESCLVLGEILGKQPTTASIPGGYYSREVARAAAACGIKILFTSEPTTSISEVDACLVVGRYAIRKSTPVSAVAAIARGNRWPYAQQAGVWFLAKAAKCLAGPLYHPIRKLLLDAAGYA